MGKGQSKGKFLYRTYKFEVHLTSEQLAIARQISSIMRNIWNRIIKHKESAWESLKPTYQAIAAAKKALSPAQAKLVWEEKASDAALLQAAVSQEVVKEREELLGRLSATFEEIRQDGIPVTFYDFVNMLPRWRQADELFRKIPQKWEEAAIDKCVAAWNSFFALRKQGDPDARRPRLREDEDRFNEISGRYGFGVTTDGRFFLNLPKMDPINKKWFFSIPEYQLQKIRAAIKMKKFTLFQDRDGRFWVSIACELEKPEEKPCQPTGYTFISLGFSRIGVVSPASSFSIKLWRPDKHWKRKIEELDNRMSSLTKDSQRYQKMQVSRRRMFAKMSRQQLHNRREIVTRLLGHGIHFVVQELVVRSKSGKLADAQDPDKAGFLGKNWAAQNTGAMSELVALLEDEVKEHGGKVVKIKPEKGRTPPPRRDVSDYPSYKIAIAEWLKASWLEKQKK